MVILTTLVSEQLTRFSSRHISTIQTQNTKAKVKFLTIENFYAGAKEVEVKCACHKLTQTTKMFAVKLHAMH